MRRRHWKLPCILACTILVACGPSAEEHAAQRVALVFETIARDGEVESAEHHVAVCRWWKDKEVFTDSTEHEWAYEAFRAFLREGSLRKGTRYEIRDAVAVEDSGNGSVLVRGTIDGSDFELLVPPRAPLAWKRAPRPS
jgi:hypothetical protein